MFVFKMQNFSPITGAVGAAVGKGVPGAKPVAGAGRKEGGQLQTVAAPDQSTPDMFDAPPPRKLSVASSVAGESGLYSCHLPEDIMVEILDDRMQVTFDTLTICLRGSLIVCTTSALDCELDSQY